MKKTKIINSINKKSLKIASATLGLAALAAATTLGATACAANQSNQEIVNKGDGTFFAKNENAKVDLNLQDAVKAALSDPAGTQQLFVSEYQQLMLDIIENFKTDNVVLTNRVQTEIDRIDEELKELKDGLNLSGRDYHIALQKELDQWGGTEESWKQSKLIDWAATFVSERLFMNDYANIINVDEDGSSTTYSSPDRSIVTQALANKVNGVATGPQLGFGAKSNTGDGIFNQEFVNANVALQQKVFEMYVKDEKPFVVNMNLWKYSEDGVGSASDDVWLLLNPVDGGVDEEGNPLPPPAPAGSYQTPYFTSLRTSDSTLTPVEKFNNFNKANISNVPEAIETLANFIPSTVDGIDNNPIGLRDEMQKNWTDDSSNFILVEPNSWSLVNEFMLASMNLFNLDNGLTDSLFTNNIYSSKPGSFVNDAVINEQFDPISRSFMSATKPTGVNSAQIKNADLKRMLNRSNPDLTPLFGSSSDIYAIDAFKSNDPLTNQFVYLRNEFGVHAIALDGWNYISTGTSFDERVEKAGDIFLYRSIQNRENSGDKNASEATQNFNIPLSEKLKVYYDANLLKIWTSIFATKESDALSQSIANGFLGAKVGENSFSSSEIDLFTSLYLYNEQNKRSTDSETRNSGLTATKGSYATTSGVNSYKNGIASPYIYGQDNKGSYNEVLMFLNNGKTLNKVNDSRNLYNNLITNIDAYITANPSATQALTSKDESFQYSQTILVNSLAVNSVVKLFTTSSDYFSNSLTNQVVEQATLFGDVKVNDIVAIANSYPTDDSAPVSFDLAMYGFNNTQVEEFNFQFINKFLGAAVSQSTIGADIGNYINVANPQGAVSVNEVQAYKQKLYFKDSYSSNLNFQTTKENLLMLTLGVNFMLEDVNKDGFFGDRFIQRVKSELSINEAANFTWWNNFSRPLMPTNTLNLVNTPEKLLLQNASAPSTMFLNQDNNLYSQYATANGGYANNVTANNIYNNVYENTGYGQTNTFTYNNAKDGKLLNGYVGLQKESSHTLPSDVNKYVFPEAQRQTGNNTTSLQGVLYQYGSRNSLLNVINTNQNTAEINLLATSIRNKVNTYAVTIKVQDILENTSLIKKQEMLTQLIQDTSLIPDLAFQSYAGYANGSNASGTLIQGEDNFTSYGAYLQQVNFEDFNYQKDEAGNVILNQGEPVELLTPVQLANNIGSNLMLDMLLNFASESASQRAAFNAIGRANQFTIYDENTRNALGEIWVKNFELK